MKKYIISLFAVLLVLSSCTKFASEDSDPVVAAGVPAITLTNPAGSQTDSSFVATIAAPEGTSYYSYLIAQTDEPQTLNPTTLMKVGYKGLVQGTVNYSVNASVSIPMTGLIPNTTYQVYAVVANTQGTIGEVVSASITTTDGLIPGPQTFTRNATAGSSAITYNEPIYLADAGAKAYATYYKYNHPSDSVTVEIPAENISISGNVLTLTAPEVQPGAYVTLTWETGLVENAVGTPGRGYLRRGYNSSNPAQSAGVTFRFPTEAWDFEWTDENEAGDTLVYFAEYNQVMPMFEGPDLWWYDYTGEIAEGVVVTYKSTSESVTTTTSYSEINWGMVDDYHIGLRFPADMDFMTTVSIALKAGIAEDVWGNPNKEYYREDAYCRMLVSTGIPGVYQTTATSYFASRGTFSWEIVITDNGAGGYTITDFEPYFGQYGLCADLTATPNADGSTLSLAGGQVVGTGSYANVLLYGGDAPLVDASEYISTEIPVVLNVLSNGWLEVANAFGCTDDPAGGYWNLMDGGYQFIKISNDPTAAVAAPASKPVPADFFKMQR